MKHEDPLSLGDYVILVLTAGLFGLSVYMMIHAPKRPHSSTLEPERERRVWLQEHGKR